MNDDLAHPHSAIVRRPEVAMNAQKRVARSPLCASAMLAMLLSIALPSASVHSAPPQEKAELESTAKPLSIFGLNLADAPVALHEKEVPDLYGPAGQRGDVFPIPIERSVQTSDRRAPNKGNNESIWIKYSIPLKRFYVEYRSDRNRADSERIYGPFAGDPLDRLRLEALLADRLREGYSPDDLYRIKLMLKTQDHKLAQRAIRLAQAAIDCRDTTVLKLVLREVRQMLADNAATIKGLGLDHDAKKLEENMAAAQARLATAAIDTLGSERAEAAKVKSELPDVNRADPVQPANPPAAGALGIDVRSRVIDAKSGKPVESFQMVPASRGRPAGTITWQSSYVKTFHDGQFAYREKRAWDATVFRIDADGYKPRITRPVLRGEANVELLVELEPDPGTFGVVLTPEGQPACGAQVARCTWTNEVSVEGDVLRFAGHGALLGKRTQTAGDGSFRLPTEIDSWLLVVSHPSGYGEISPAEFSKSQTIRLQPWGRLEGDFIVGGKPIPDQKIDVGGGRGGGDEVNLDYSNSVATDAEGKFVVKRLPPVVLFVHPIFKMDDNSWASPLWFSGNIKIEPGKTTRISLPRSGRPLKGQVTLPTDSSLTLADLDIEATIFLRPPSVSGFRDMVQKDFQVYGQFMESPIGKQFKRDKIPIDVNGTFDISDLPETEYVLQVRAMEKNSHVEEGRQPWQGFHARPITVLPMADSADPVELGQILLSPSR
jgi:hypothetical protein